MDADLAQRMWVRLRERWESESHLPLEQRLATLQAIGMCGAPDAARFLSDLSQAYPERRLEGLSAHRWICMQVANGGVVGRDVLYERLTSEEDPLRRLDLIWAYATIHGDEQVREGLLALVEDDALHPLERLFSAERLVRVGPSHAVAPRLKRVLPRIEHDQEAIAALRCLMWKWY